MKIRSHSHALTFSDPAAERQESRNQAYIYTSVTLIHLIKKTVIMSINISLLIYEKLNNPLDTPAFPKSLSCCPRKDPSYLHLRSLKRTRSSGFHHMTCSLEDPSQSRLLSTSSRSYLKWRVARVRLISTYAKLFSSQLKGPQSMTSGGYKVEEAKGGEVKDKEAKGKMNEEIYDVHVGD